MPSWGLFLAMNEQSDLNFVDKSTRFLKIKAKYMLPQQHNKNPVYTPMHNFLSSFCLVLWGMKLILYLCSEITLLKRMWKLVYSDSFLVSL